MSCETALIEVLDRSMRLSLGQGANTAKIGYLISIHILQVATVCQNWLFSAICSWRAIAQCANEKIGFFVVILCYF